MYHPDVIAHREAALIAALGIPRLQRRSHDECWAMRDVLASAVNEKGILQRDLSDAEQSFITSERLLWKLDFHYGAERYIVINKEAQEDAPMYPLWASQDLFLQRIAQIEHERWRQGHPDGILVNVLKARQLGLSTVSEALLAHRVSSQASVRGIVVGDVPEQSTAMFTIAELVLDNLPWWLYPGTRAKSTGHSRVLMNKSSLRVGAGKSQRGGLQEQGGTKGNVGRGKTFSLAHLTEISTWERPEQISDGLLPGVPRTSRTLVMRESTAKGRNDYWHNEWRAAERNRSRLLNVFIPWYIEPNKYWLPAPAGWVPSATTQEHIDKVTTDSPKWLVGKTHRLTKEQAYWYEFTRQEYEDKDKLHVFLEEWPATPEDAFQHAGRSIFSANALERIKRHQAPPIDVWLVEPAKDIAQLRAWEAKRAAETRG